MKILGLFMNDSYVKLFEKQGYSVFKEENDLLQQFLQETVIVLIDELAFLRILKKKNKAELLEAKQVLWIVLTDKTKSAERIRLLEKGAHLVWSNQLTEQELAANLQGLSRFFGEQLSNQVPQKIIVIDEKQKQVFVEGHEVLLTASEYLILQRMMMHEMRIYEREELMQLVSNNESGSTVRVIDTHIKNLRKKIEKDARHPRFIKTVHGRGYRFEPNWEEK
ncbi:two-component system response regulator RegX3 [Enterococcus sp. PF1-24]|uniref:winged helix-turn-helix transcriptional regulator n=1 Tax=unclassified Enterococcus TaxID=2608891 RepID=UPI002474B87C|nr:MULTISPECIES: response regulator transcription factor [unclassified Enterococcus]MDH6365163.1 two-component system response regulator RegX3 [Enterococcus sp. PFB1-1]MDH6402253.1 two-component system response regulator RegX3 [Enterococcus sp. PF1-24]